MKLIRCGVVLLLLLATARPSRSQDPPLKGLIGVRVSLTWTGGTDADRGALQADVESKLRQAGMQVLAPTGLPVLDSTYPLLFIGVGAAGTAVPVGVELHEQVYLARDRLRTMKWTAFDAWGQWYNARVKEPGPITDAEKKEHMAPVEAQAKENEALPFPPPRDATTWLRHGIAQSNQPESVKNIIARYAPNPYWQTPAGRPIVQHMMDLEVQAAMAEAQRPTSPGTVRETIKGYVDQFLNEWLAANPKQH